MEGLQKYFIKVFETQNTIAHNQMEIMKALKNIKTNQIKSEERQAKIEAKIERLAAYIIKDHENVYIDFKKIENENDLREITHKLCDPSYVSNLINFLKHKYGNLKLNHLISRNFLYEFNFDGTKGNKELGKLDLYTNVFILVNSSKGISIENIHDDARKELKQIKNSLFKLRSLAKLRNATKKNKEEK